MGKVLGKNREGQGLTEYIIRLLPYPISPANPLPRRSIVEGSGALPQSRGNAFHFKSSEFTRPKIYRGMA